MLVLVTGGSGFLGSRIAEKLLEDNREVRVLTRRPVPNLEKSGAEVFFGDLRDPDVSKKATGGVGAVIHAAAKAGVWGPEKEYLEANLEGTRRLLAASEENGVSRFVLTSTASVVFDGKDLNGVDESAPYAFDSVSNYARSKALAEELVLSRNGETFKTLALRPHIVWGPGDPHFAPRVAALRKSGRLKLIKGGPYMFDGIFVDNAADCHVHALKKLEEGAPVSGEAFFLTQGEPMDSRDFLNKMLDSMGLPPLKPTISVAQAKIVSRVLEFLWKLFRVENEPPLTLFAVQNLTCSHYFDLTKTRELLGYSPGISVDEGFALMKKHFLAKKS
ncbi:MAG: NAD-dependent epimerase/dehydratase family protein [Deltaproteobacteria bacterium]|jgi:nucleoside-diphosphate-sugar epimerase|nr:NAD-dependent epimerase/dehydratase family protein [Deltaproteobacteria bacterium]